MVTPLMRPHLFILTQERGKSSFSSDLSIILHILSNASSSTPGAFDHRLKFRKFGLPAKSPIISRLYSPFSSEVLFGWQNHLIFDFCTLIAYK